MVIRTNKKVLLGCFMTSIDSTKNGNSGTGESFLFRVAENNVDSWFWNENNPSIFAVFTKERYEIQTLAQTFLSRPQVGSRRVKYRVSS